VPPADLLVRIADAGGVDLRWLLTGRAHDPAVPAGHPAVGRIATLLADRPGAAAPLTAFVDLLAESLSWPAKPAAAGGPGGAAGAAAGAVADAHDARRDWIPILGRSAAGVPRFWADADDARGVTTLTDLIARHADAARDVRPAVAADAEGRGDRVAQLITLRGPDDAGVAEFVAAADIKRAHGDAFAVRIDGDSMAPEILHGDVVVCSPSADAADGRAAVVQLEGQIGVTCKLFRRAGETVHLVPVNERYAPQSFPAEALVWALRVLARVRATGDPHARR